MTDTTALKEFDPTRSSRRINRLISVVQAKTYLEVGVCRGATFMNVNVGHKDGVDPSFRFNHKAYGKVNCRFFECTSDEFFYRHADRKYDLIFLDGLHEFKQTARDFFCSLSFSHDNTLWIIDDVIPSDIFSANPNQDEALKVRHAHGFNDRSWHGDVYKIVPLLHDYFPVFSYVTLVDGAFAQTLAWRKPRSSLDPICSGLEEIERLDYYWLLANRRVFNITDELVAEGLLLKNYGSRELP